MASDEIGGVPQLDVASAFQRVAGGAFLLDVRDADEWAAGHAPEATHVPLNEINARYEDVLPKDRPIIAVCRSGGRSQRAAVALRNAGYDVSNVTGGMQAWLNEGLGVVADDGSPGSVV